MIAIRRARTADAVGIGDVHVASWRSTYAGVLPEPVLTGLSAQHQAGYYDRVIRAGGVVHVAVASGADAGEAGGTIVVGFITARRRRRGGLAEGEIETLYVLDDYRERGLGRQLLGAAAAHLAAKGCNSAFVWVLADNPSRWFYARMGGRHVADGTVGVGGAQVPQAAYRWEPIDVLINS